MKSKFKAGDLVLLSAAGNKAHQNEECRGGFGFIVTIDMNELNKLDSHSWPIKTTWWTKDMKVMNINFKPYELKFYKKK